MVNIESLRVRGEETVCFFETLRPEQGMNPRSPIYKPGGGGGGGASSPAIHPPQDPPKLFYFAYRHRVKGFRDVPRKNIDTNTFKSTLKFNFGY